MIYEKVVRPLLFALSHGDAEVAHEAAIQLLAALNRQPWLCRLIERSLGPTDPMLRTQLFNNPDSERMDVKAVTLPSPIMLAAGFDKNLRALRALGSLGFGGIEAGTLTPHAQKGKPRPRIFRLPKQRSLINRMGFPNLGGVRGGVNLADTLDDGHLPVPVGISIGSGINTPPEHAIQDYVAVLWQIMHPSVSWVSINVSSPNTPAARVMASGEFISELLSAIDEVFNTWHGRYGWVPARLVKLSPDMKWREVDVVLAARGYVDGYIAVNTTTQVDDFPEMQDEAGGRSGPPLLRQAKEFMHYLRRNVGPHKTLIGVGGVSSARDVLALKSAGAHAVQVYTGFIYGGPLAPWRWNRDLVKILSSARYANFAEYS